MLPNNDNYLELIEQDSLTSSAIQTPMLKGQSAIQAIEFELLAAKKALQESEDARTLAIEARITAENAKRLAREAQLDSEIRQQKTTFEKKQARIDKALAEGALHQSLSTVKELNVALDKTEASLQIVQKALQQTELAEDRYRLVLEGSDSGLWDWDLSTGKIYWNGRFFRMLGIFDVNPEPSLEYLWSLVHPDDQAQLMERIHSELKNKQNFVEIFRIRHHSGEYLYCECRGKTTFNEQNQPIRVAGTITNISKRIEDQATINLYTSQQESLAQIGLRALSGVNLPDILEHCTLLIAQALRMQYLKLWEWLPDSKKLRCLTVIGWDQALKGKEFLAGDPRISFAMYTIGQKEPVIIVDAKQESRFVLPSPEENITCGICAPIFTRNTSALLGCLELTATTHRLFSSVDQKFLESATTILSLALQRQKAEAERMQYLQKLEASNQDLEKFAFVTSHDLQNPLRKIKAFASHLQKDLPKDTHPEVTDDLTRMQRSIDSMQILIDDLLALSRVSSGPGMVNLESIVLSDILLKVKDGLYSEIKNSEAQIDINVTCTVKGDKAQLYQLFENLLQNALTFQSPGNTPQITISSVIDPPFCEIAVHDNGIGFENSQVEQIFHIFERLSNKTYYPGSGIGLAICQRIVERHNGTIRAESQPGKGSTFIVRLPLA